MQDIMPKLVESMAVRDKIRNECLDHLGKSVCYMTTDNSQFVVEATKASSAATEAGASRCPFVFLDLNTTDQDLSHEVLKECCEFAGREGAVGIMMPFREVRKALLSEGMCYTFAGESKTVLRCIFEFEEDSSVLPVDSPSQFCVFLLMMNHGNLEDVRDTHAMVKHILESEAFVNGARILRKVYQKKNRPPWYSAEVLAISGYLEGHRYAGVVHNSFSRSSC